MKTRTAVTAALLTFVAASAVYWIVSESRSKSQASEASPPAPTASSDHVTVYYFHGAARCETCVKFETYTSEVLRESFPRELADGQLKWKVVDVEEPVNEHFIQDYQLTSKAVIVAQYRGGQQTAWKNLEEIWALAGDEAAFKKYIRDGVANLLKAK